MQENLSFLAKRLLRLMGLAFLVVACSVQQKSVTISTTSDDPMIGFAIEELTAALEQQGIAIKTVPGNGDIAFHIQAGTADLKPEGFRIRKDGNSIRVSGLDAAGVMYGGLELAEQVRVSELAGVEEMIRNPYLEMRGTKFNIPLDVRTPSYTDVCDAAQHNIPEMWSFDFWREYIDNLARYRYNFISLWSLHPFPSLVRVHEYPEVALDDVQRSTADFEEFYSLNGIGFDAPEILENVEIIREITMEEKIAFWKKVMAYGRNRNIDFYVVTWNIFVNGTGGKYGITDEIGNATTRDYFRRSVKQLFLTYPDLAGVGLTTGENMHGADFEEKETWAFETYAQGMLDAAAEMPDRQFTFIHRQHQTGAIDIARKFKTLIEHPNIDFIFSFKYAKAHVFSATEQPYHEEFVKEIEGMKTIWTLRNDDSYQYRWGAPDFVREFIRNIPYEVSQGYYYGSDQWIWGREFLSLEPEDPRQLEIVKHWYNWMLWGRLGYDPGLSNERFIDILQAKFPDTDAEKLFTAWQEASMIYPTATGFHWGSLDFQWYIEACKSHPRFSMNETGFHDVNRFISLPPHPRSGYQSIPEYVKMVREGGSSDLKSPLDASRQLHEHADKALALAETLDAGGHKELAVTLADIHIVALLGKYYAHKIAGATHFAQYRESQEKTLQDEAVEQLTRAREYWQQYVERALGQNRNPLWLNRVGYVDWEKISAWVEQDIAIVRSE
jgi:hypothetical protein